MKLVLVNYEYPPLGGGAGNATAHLARALYAQGHDVTVVTARHGNRVGWFDDDGVHLLRLRSRRKRIDRASLFEMASYVLHACWVVPRLARSTKADGCIVFFSLPCGPIGWLTRQWAGTPYVVALRGGDVPGAEASVSKLQRLLAPIRRTVLARAAAITANSKGLADISAATDPFQIDVIANGVDASYFCPPGNRLQRNEVQLLFAGRFNGQKNLVILLRQFAVASKNRPYLRLVMVGDGPHRDILLAEAERLGIGKSIAWMGWLNKADLSELYRQADIFVNPSLYEGMPNTVLEAMASGLPVIASAVAGNNELVIHGENGLLFDLAKPSALADAIGALADDASLRASFGRAARATVQAEFSWHAAARNYAGYFQAGVS